MLHNNLSQYLSYIINNIIYIYSSSLPKYYTTHLAYEINILTYSVLICSNKCITAIEVFVAKQKIAEI